MLLGLFSIVRVWVDPNVQGDVAARGPLSGIDDAGLRLSVLGGWGGLRPPRSILVGVGWGPASFGSAPIGWDFVFLRFGAGAAVVGARFVCAGVGWGGRGPSPVERGQRSAPDGDVWMRPNAPGGRYEIYG